ncbi:MAG: hypothetical protein ACYC8V_13665 [Caulobacteraceae bacterium]
MQTATAVQAKPTYLGLLNAISLAESDAGAYLCAWAGATEDPELAATLRLVAARETSHGDLFRRRLNELGYDLRPKPDAAAQKRMSRLADPQVADLEKLPPERPRPGDPFKDIIQRLASGEFDAMTANLVSWYIEEERDSEVRLAEAYARVRAKANGATRKASDHDPAQVSADSAAIMACMTAGFARVEKSLEKLAKALK